jgi:hypothetical protein
MLAVTSRTLLSGALAVVLISCGGGTTGTSPTVVKFLGAAQDASGAGVSNTSMTVSSSPSGEVLVAASTDGGGRFEMTLPASEVSVDVAVEGATPLTVQRSIGESSAVFAAVTINSTKQSSLASQVEARIVGSSCDGLSVTPLSVDAKAVATTQANCDVQIEVSTSAINSASSEVVVSGQCRPQGKRSEFVTVESSGRETVTVDIASALRSSCDALAIEVRSNGDDAQAIQFGLER